MHHLPAASITAAIIVSVAAAQPTEILVSRDYMTSGFFFGVNLIRGDQNPSTREVNRVTSTAPFGVTGENAYFEFDFDPTAFSGPVSEAFFRVETLAPGFFDTPSALNPAEISLHSLTADPLASIDDNLASGPGSYIDFRDSQITTSSIISTTTIDGLGIFSWDITSLVNEWIANGDTNFSYTIGTSALLDTNPNTGVAFINSSFEGLSGQLTPRIVIPAPGAASLLAASGLLATRRKRLSA